MRPHIVHIIHPGVGNGGLIEAVYNLLGSQLGKDLSDNCGEFRPSIGSA